MHFTSSVYNGWEAKLVRVSVLSSISLLLWRYCARIRARHSLPVSSQLDVVKKKQEIGRSLYTVSMPRQVKDATLGISVYQIVDFRVQPCHLILASESGSWLNPNGINETIQYHTLACAKVMLVIFICPCFKSPDHRTINLIPIH